MRPTPDDFPQLLQLPEHPADLVPSRQALGHHPPHNAKSPAAKLLGSLRCAGDGDPCLFLIQRLTPLDWVTPARSGVPLRLHGVNQAWGVGVDGTRA